MQSALLETANDERHLHPFPVASLLAAGGVAAFIWAVRRGQFDDLDTPAVRILHEDEDEGHDCSR